MAYQRYNTRFERITEIPIDIGTPQAPVPDYATVLAEAQTMRFREYEDPRWTLLYTRQRWVGCIEWRQGMIWFSNHDSALCEALWLAYKDWSRQEERAQEGFTSESAFVTYIEQYLAPEGWSYAREVRTPYGRIDLVVERAGVRWIIEAKLGTSAPEMTCVLGQLLCAHETYPEGQLWFATPASIPARWNTILTRYNITILEGPWTKTV